MIRKALNSSQIDFGKAIGYSACFISELENNKKKPSVATIHKLFTVFNVNLYYLFTGVGEMFLPDTSGLFEDNREYVPQIRTIRDLLWFVHHSHLFRDWLMAMATQYHLQNEEIIKKTLKPREELPESKGQVS